MSVVDLYLASTSPRRRELLQQIGVRFAVLNVAVHEEPQSNESPHALVQRLAQDKAVAGWHSLPQQARKPVLGADTVVVIDGHVLGKPRDKSAGLAMLQRLSARSHQVYSAVALCHDTCSVMVNCSEVSLRALSLEECVAYWDSGEPRDKAGAYAIQGKAAVFIQSLHGSYSAVMGLPLYETVQLLQQFNIPYWTV
ncbi:MAG: septum formation inhibitor Maf [Gammaproteobacteria bacterium]|nr:septum formation inhibitor Maf [Gammaproteobacteria bacterium]